MSAPHLLVHNKKDNVGVVVAEDLRGGDEMLCVVTEDDSDFRLTALHSVPLGHKIALAELAAGDAAIKYGEDIGAVTKAVAKGGHVHTHNLKTKRW